MASNLRRMGIRFGFERDWYLYLVAALIGLFMGFAAVLFIWPLRQSEFIGEQLQGSSNLFWLILLGPSVGGLITGVLIAWLKHEGVGPGVTAVIYAVQRKKGRLSLKIGLRKWLTSTATIALGGSAGAEGPIVTIGAVVGSNLSKVLGTGTQHTGTLLGCGAAAGLASVFNAPIAGIFFVMELILRDFSLKTFTPIVIAAVVSSATTQGLLGDAAIFDVGDNFFNEGLQFSITQIPVYLVLGLVCGLLGATFIKTLDYTERAFVATKLPIMARPFVGAIVLGIIGITAYTLSGSQALPEFYGNGYPVIKTLLDPTTYFANAETGELQNAMPFLSGLILLALVKLVATCVTVGSGGAGGLFAPSLLIGAASGGCIGFAVHYFGWFPETSPAYFALVGMAAMVAATTHAPLTAILIVYEVTQSYEVILPLMFAAVVGTIVARLVSKDSIYTFKLSRLGVRMGAMSDLTILRRLTSQDVPLKEAIPVLESDSAQKLLELMEKTGASDFVVTDVEGHYAGMVVSDDFREALVYRESIPLLQVSELRRCDLPTVSPEETLDIVLDKFSRSDVQSLVVLDDSDQITGLITRSSLMARYQKALDADVDQ